ncbi:hypothetical protein [Candidatus Magnetomonas plexicatena]|uniref:hypothetical protein n=1 Tax=Candidatus Magnetomonas plexicatena TaxID=2552947 RepID=UPI001C73EFE8|nr:hypothetical protein E2O03_015150 [Nitrospirales bacterium LBB_01]
MDDIDLCMGSGRFIKLSERREVEYKLIPLISPDNRVLGGPFKGILYDNMDLVGSAIIPKVLGCYETEIHTAIENACEKNYSDIINIGSGEGYYAVGFAKRIPGVTVYAFDTNHNAANICSLMAGKNGVHNQILIGGHCTVKWLSEIKFSKKGLIFCDCEGCELDLLDLEKLPNLKDWDIIVELHDFLNPAISATIKERFSATHNITEFHIIERNPSDYPVLKGFTKLEQEIAVSEYRPAGIQWMSLDSN